MYEEGNPPKKLPIEIFKEVTESKGYIFKSVKYLNQKSTINFICKKHLDCGIQSSAWNDISNDKQCCGYCNGKGRTTKQFKEIVFEQSPNIKIIGEYKGARERVDAYCTIHDYFWKPSAFRLMSGTGCPKCGDEIVKKKKTIPYEIKKEKLESIHANNIEFLHIPNNTHDKVKCRCLKCKKEWETSYFNLTKPNYTGCPNCIESKNEKRLKNIMDKWGYRYTSQKTFSNCKDRRLLPFDLYLDDFNVLIEYDGEHHYKMIPRGLKTQFELKEDFELVKKHDSIKNKYCKENKIPLIRIPYWEKENMEYFLFDKFKELNLII